MRATWIVIGSLLFALWAKTSFFYYIPLLSPNLYLLFVVLFIIRWKGPEVYYIAAIFGIMADVYSTMSFGVYGFSFFLMSFPLRWYAIKMFQGSVFSLPILVGFLGLVLKLIIFVVGIGASQEVGLKVGWIREMLLFEILPTALLAPYAYTALVILEKMGNIRLHERKF
ncbi:MAG: rod shape-determining protein MreD [SAR324 cluster bacterium]|nr:rod shape-determining protein MreD [SAR324 cluster bacterium]